MIDEINKAYRHLKTARRALIEAQNALTRAYGKAVDAGQFEADAVNGVLTDVEIAGSVLYDLMERAFALLHLDECNCVLPGQTCDVCRYYAAKASESVVGEL